MASESGRYQEITYFWPLLGIYHTYLPNGLSFIWLSSEYNLFFKNGATKHHALVVTFCLRHLLNLLNVIDDGKREEDQLEAKSIQSRIFEHIWNNMQAWTKREKELLQLFSGMASDWGTLETSSLINEASSLICQKKEKWTMAKELWRY